MRTITQADLGPTPDAFDSESYGFDYVELTRYARIRDKELLDAERALVLAQERVRRLEQAAREARDRLLQDHGEREMHPDCVHCQALEVLNVALADPAGEEGRRDMERLVRTCDRLLATETEVLAMDDSAARDWFMSKPGHRDCFTVARALKSLLGLGHTGKGDDGSDETISSQR